jgi:sec-independent protein translocase protein TatC
MSIWWSLIISMPFIIYQIWLFVAPGLYEKEKRLFKLFMPLTFGLFWAGGAFAWFFFIPFTVGFSSGLIWEGTEFLPRLQNCMSFTLKTVFFSGIFFEMPLIMFLLLKTELISRDFFIKNRKKIYPGIYLLILIMLPGDFFLQFLFFITIILLFEFFLIVYKYKLNNKLTS